MTMIKEKISPFEFLYERFDEDALLRNYEKHKGDKDDLLNVKTAGGEIAPRIAVLAAVVPYLDAAENITHWKDYKKIDILPESDKAAELLDRASLLDLLKRRTDAEKTDRWIYPYCRYAPDKNIRELIESIKKNRKTKEEIYYTRKLPIGPLLLSDSKTAIIELNNAEYYFRTPPLEDYAGMRGADSDYIIDEALMNIGLNERGEKEYDLGGFKVRAALTADLKLSLYNEKTGTFVKTMPKRGADREKYERAEADFDELKHSLKITVKARFDRLLQSFLNAHDRSVEDWKSANLKNPLNRQIAKLFVWEQNGITFTVKDRKPADSSGNELTLTDLPVKLAHPMEMTKEDTAAWKKYFAENDIEQPFRQIWELVRNPDTIKEERYGGIEIPLVYFFNQLKHGIICTRNIGNRISLSLSDCSIRYQSISNLGYPYKGSLILFYSFKFDKYTRKANHIVSILDRWTLNDRIKKDDMSVIDQMDEADAAQLEEYTQIAIKNGCKNLTAKLLELKKERFPERGSLDEFTIGEW